MTVAVALKELECMKVNLHKVHLPAQSEPIAMSLGPPASLLGVKVVAEGVYALDVGLLTDLKARVAERELVKEGKVTFHVPHKGQRGHREAHRCLQHQLPSPIIIPALKQTNDASKEGLGTGLPGRRKDGAEGGRAEKEQGQEAASDQHGLTRLQVDRGSAEHVTAFQPLINY